MPKLRGRVRRGGPTKFVPKRAGCLTGVDPTRRRLLAGAASSLALISFGARSQDAAQARDRAPGLSGTADEQSLSSLEPIADDAARLTVPVKLNGNGPFDFIVDTGADGTVIADDLVNAAGLTRGAPVLVRGVTRSTVSDSAIVSRLLVGSIERRNLVVPALPRQVLEADGYLGLDVIDGHRVTFDFKNKLLTVGTPRPRFAIGWTGSHEERVAARGTSGHLRFVNCLVDGVHATAFLDTGAQISACNLSLLHALMRRKATQGTSGTIEISGVTGGKIEGTVTSVDKIQLESLAIDQCALVVADFEVFRIWGLSRTPALLIGMNLLRSFAKVSIDYGRQEIGFELGHSPRPELPVYAGHGRREPATASADRSVI